MYSWIADAERARKADDAQKGPECTDIALCGGAETSQTSPQF
jgi:hypothetical protein